MYVERKPSPEESQAKPRRRFMGEMDGVKVYDTTPEYTGKELESRATEVAEFFLWFADQVELVIARRKAEEEAKEAEENRQKLEEECSKS